MKPINFLDLLKTVGENLHTIRSARKEILDKAADAVGVKHPVISRIENGRYTGLSLELLVKLCNHYKVSLQQVLGLEVMQIFNLSQNAEDGSSNASFKQVVHEVAEGYHIALQQANTEISFLRNQLEFFSRGSQNGMLEKSEKTSNARQERKK